MYNHVLLLLLLVVSKSIRSQLYDFDCLRPYCFCSNLNVLNCNNFTSFEQLDFTRTNGRIFECVELHPFNTQLDLNERLKFTGLHLNGRLIISNIKSFNAFYNPFRQITYSHLSISFFNSLIKFYGNSASIIDSGVLNECKYDSTVYNFNFVFGNLKLVEFSTYYCYFAKPICPLYFQNSKIDYFNLIDPVGAFGFTNVVYSISSMNTSFILNTSIRQIDFSYGVQNLEQPEWLDSQCILNVDLFKDLNRINLNIATRLSYIQEDTFKNLPNVKKLELNKVPLKDLLLRNRRWLKNLNYNQPVFNFENQRLSSILMEKIFKLIIWADSWTFNEEKDICLFRNFPHEKLVFPFIINSPTSLPCTCTIYWMYKNLAKYQTIYSLNQNIIPMHCFTSSSNWDRCQFGALFNKYCPSSVTDPDEPFTTLRPSTNLVTFTTFNYTTYSTNPTYVLQNATATTSTLERRDSDFAVLLAVCLTIAAIFITSIILILCYKVFIQSRRQQDVITNASASTTASIDEYKI